jgi:hypothetical protein
LRQGAASIQDPAGRKQVLDGLVAYHPGVV